MVSEDMSGCGGRSSGNSEDYRPEHYSHEQFIGAARHGNQVLLKKALDQNPSYLNKIDNDSKATAVLYAAANGYYGCLDVLIEAKADLTAQHNNKTALEYAIYEGNNKCIETLLKAGASTEKWTEKNIKQYEGLIEKYCPEQWAEIKQKIKEKAEQARLKKIFKPYSMVNDFIVIKREGEVQGLGKISTMFNFNAKTVTEIVNDNPGTPQKFDADNKDQIMMAHDFTVYKKVEAPPPFKKVQKVKI